MVPLFKEPEGEPRQVYFFHWLKSPGTNKHTSSDGSPLKQTMGKNNNMFYEKQMEELGTTQIPQEGYPFSVVYFSRGTESPNQKKKR